MFVKLVYGLQIHLYSGRLSFLAIRSHAETVFKKLPRQYILCYMTQGGQKKAITSDKDLSGLKCGVLKMIISDFDDGLLSAKSESSFSDFDDFVDHQQDQKQFSIPSNKWENDVGKSITRKTQKSGRLNIDQYSMCDFNSEDEPEQDNLLASIDQHLVDQFVQDALQKIGIQQEQALLQSDNQKYRNSLQQQVANTILTQQAQLLNQLSKNLVSSIGKKCIAQTVNKIQRQCNLAVNEDTFTFQFNGSFNQFLDKLFANATQKLLAQESKNKILSMKKDRKDRKTIQNIPRLYYQKIKAKSLGHKQQSKKKRSKSVKSAVVKKTPLDKLNLSLKQSNAYELRQDTNIDAIVEKKLKGMLPQIISQVSQMLEQRLSKKSCNKCQRSELQVQRLIAKQMLSKRLREAEDVFERI